MAFRADLSLCSRRRPHRGRAGVLLAALAGLLVGAGAAPAIAAGDTTAPQLTSVSISTPSLNISYAAAQLGLTVHATDDLSGVRDVQVDLFGPGNAGGDQTGDDIRGFCTLASGTGQDGTWTCSVPVPRYSHSGVWHIGVFVLDAVPNVGHYSSADLTAHGWRSSFTVTGTSDITGPEIDDVAVAPSSIDPSSAAPVVLSFVGRDDMTGLARLQVDLRSPSGRWVYQLPCDLPAGNPTAAGITCSWTPAVGTETGRWTARVRLSDGANNVTVLGSDDGSSGPSFTVTGESDLVPPVLTSFSWPTDPQDLTTSPDPYVSVPATFTATDAGSGLRNWAQVDLTAPGNSGTWAMNCSITAGDVHTATYSCAARLSRFAQSGRWTFDHVWLQDAAGNIVMYDANGGSPSLTAVTTVAPDLHILPGAPGSPSVAPAAGGTAVSWDPAPVYGGEPVTDYTVTATPYTGTAPATGTPAPSFRAAAVMATATATPVSLTVSGSKTSALVPGLVAGISYDVKVTARNSGGTRTATSRIVAPQSLPAPVAAPTSTPTATPTQAPAPTPVPTSLPTASPTHTTVADHTAPVLAAVSPPKVRTAAGPRVVDIAVQAKDTGSGVAAVRLTLRRPDGKATVTSSSCRLTKGAATSGTWTCRVTLPARAQLGSWSVAEARITDKAGNAAHPRAVVGVTVTR